MEHNSKSIISVVNFKGGVGKTTTTQTIAACIQKLHPKWNILLIDLDPQCNLSYLMGWDDLALELGITEARTIYDSLTRKSEVHVYRSEKGIYYVPGSEDMQNVEPSLNQDIIPSKVLGKCLMKGYIDHSKTLHEDGVNEVFSDFDVILIDCPPALSLSTNNAIACCTDVLIPVQMETLSAINTMKIVNKIEEVKQINDFLQNIYLLPVMVDSRLSLGKNLDDYLNTQFGDKFLKNNSIRRAAAVPKAQLAMMDILEFDSKSTAAQDYMELTKMLCKSMEA